MDNIPKMRPAEDIVQDFLPMPIDKALKNGQLMSVRTMHLAVLQALKEAEESMGAAMYLKGYKDGYASALEEISKLSKELLTTVDNL